MAGALDIREQLVFYRKYHFNHTNVAIHLACIPLILLLALAMANNRELWGPEHPYATVGTLVAWGYGAYYCVLDWLLGVPLLAFLALFVRLLRTFYLGMAPLGRSQYMPVAVGVHVVCWLMQFYGHAVHEKRAPALFDNLLQALVLAPFFVVYEVAFAAGYKLDVKRDMDNKAGVLVAKMNAEARAKHQ